MKKSILIIALFFCALIANAQNQEPEPPLIDIPAPVDSAQYKVIEAPEFPGGIEKFIQYIYSHIHINVEERGRVMVKFIIEKDGSVTNVKIVKGLYDAIDNVIFQVVKRSPKWSPGIQNGKPVRVTYSVPVIFN